MSKRTTEVVHFDTLHTCSSCGLTSRFGGSYPCCDAEIVRK
ncbi:hypothetical protein Plhal304r1_c021g0074321 [Plasmopara halstedii]